MKKISLNKSDEVAEIVEKIIETESDKIILSVPRFSHIGESLSNFHLLKREAGALDKEIIIESVDDHVIELAEMSGLSALNPFFTKNKRQFSDIVVLKADGLKKRKKFKDEFEALEPEIEPEISDVKKKPFFKLPEFKPPKFDFSAFWPESKNKFLIIGSAILGLSLLLVIGLKVLPRAEVNIISKKQNWIYNDSIITEKSAVFDTTKMSIPNQIFSQKKNVFLKFPANGKREVQKKATGSITVYNSYSSDPQQLVANTRFTSPDGKTFKLIKGITVPGAKIIEGNKIPSSIEAEVIADQAGPEYNIGPVKLFNIPGFKGGPKYQNFYGESKNDMTGGFIGQIAYPTNEDINKGKAEAQKTLNDSLKTAIFSQIPEKFKVLEGATQYKIIQTKIDEEADEKGQFGVFIEAEITAIVFEEDTLKLLLEERAVKDNGQEFYLKESVFEYGLPRADFDRGKLTFPVRYTAILARKIDIEPLRSKIFGKPEVEFKAVIFSIPGLESATVSLWPFWVKKVPTSPDKVKIAVD